MATYKVVDADQLDADMTEVADAIRSKGGTSAELAWPDGYKSAVAAIQKQKPEQEKSVTPTQTVQSVTPDSGYVLNKVTVEAIPAEYADISGVTAGAGDVVYGKSVVGADGSTVEGSMHRREYTGEIVSTVLGSGVYAVLAQDDFLAEHRNDETLFVRVEFDIEPTAYTVAKNFTSNDAYNTIWDSTVDYQKIFRWSASAEKSVNQNTNPPNVTDNPGGVGFVQITETGELRCYSNSSNYAIRPSTYEVVVEW